MNKRFNKITGDKGEILAAQYLKKNKYKIVETNFKNKLGEIDIIAQKDDYLIFVEVKSRETCAFGRPCEMVTKQKQHNIRRVAESYLKQHYLLDQDCRFDVIEILDEEINHLENCF